MKLKIDQIQANPFKKSINGGEIDEQTVKKLISNIDELGLMGSLPVVEKDNQYFLVYGHHRLEALKRVYGSNFFIDVDLKKYNDDQLLRGMVIENLTQRKNEFREELDNLLAIRKYLRSLSDQKSNGGRPPKRGSSRDISNWLDKTSGTVMKLTKIKDLLRISDNLDDELLDDVKKQSHATGKKEDEDESLGVKIATVLSSFEDKQEQKDLAKAIRESKEQHGNKVYKNITTYKNASEGIKQKVRSGELDLADAEYEIDEETIKENFEKQPKTKFIPNFNQQMKTFDANVAKLELQVKLFREVFHHPEFDKRYRTLKPKQKKSLNTAIFDIHDRIKKCYDEVEFFMDRLPKEKLVAEVKE